MLYAILDQRFLLSLQSKSTITFVIFLFNFNVIVSNDNKTFSHLSLVKLKL